MYQFDSQILTRILETEIKRVKKKSLYSFIWFGSRWTHSFIFIYERRKKRWFFSPLFNWDTIQLDHNFDQIEDFFSTILSIASTLWIWIVVQKNQIYALCSNRTSSRTHRIFQLANIIRTHFARAHQQIKRKLYGWAMRNTTTSRNKIYIFNS